ncbi:acetyl-coenzyme A carboxylase biotin carboxyl carrier protein subunit AccB [Gottschalkia acidurici 9a]|uniref:Biotin carboxyl carrier protein of acetyl-CoA carboxylase n=1 Tax=Gottschalkia acidurici (strain ATCC 7906 / DSM 604 / BCRC 14475 / CIP 104303 / KCTC 5404 / NCIMB 10678 / 9a) TaxID=1128398 RepID=K0B041_GOTA9|nr:acetyl-CoA carboxylase biotin carboxyl carrier protein [Gottschalkia acidurici]AFS79393.1 acetyl-coenzyme A carboxylase biotin carboxyl carrier protein subunit AccB [Gottschalkia acidurici 9a]
MEIKDIKDLILTMDKTSIEKVDIENNGFKISISKNIKVEKSNSEVVYAQPNAIEETVKIQGTVPVQKETIELNEVPQENTEDYKDMFVVKSPIVGTFYSSPSPDADNFVKIGDRVKEGQTLCIIEAMKIMNQIESEISGEIFEILVENEDIVEYNQPLMIIRR